MVDVVERASSDGKVLHFVPLTAGRWLLTKGKHIAYITSSDLNGG